VSIWTSLFGGTETKTMPGDPTLEDWQNKMFNFDPGLGFAGKQAKKTLRALNSGEDVSSLGYFNSIAQRHASNRRDIGDSYGYGGNALLASSGGEQANILNRMRDTALQRDREAQGNETVDALANLRDSATNTFENARQTRLNSSLSGMNSALGNRLGYWQNRYRQVQTPGILGTLAGLAQGAGSFMTGGAGAGLWGK
jgi:hypothetical protein